LPFIRNAKTHAVIGSLQNVAAWRQFSVIRALIPKMKAA